MDAVAKMRSAPAGATTATSEGLAREGFAMPSAWIITRPTRDGGKRYRVLYRLGGRESKNRYGGSFKRKADAEARQRWILGELAARRHPDIGSLETTQAAAPTFKIT